MSMRDITPVVKSINIGDADVEYLYYEGGGKTIVLLHATGFLPWLWHPLAREFSQDYTVIAPYFCDHRDADYDKGLNWLVLAEDFFKLCRKLDLHDPFLAGHSMGGTVIAIANAAYGLSAEKIVLIEPIFLPEQIYQINLTVEQHPLAAKAVRRKNFWSDREEAKAYLRSKPLFSKWDEEMLDLYLKYGMISGDTGGLTLACAPKREAALFMGSVRYNPWPLLPMITCPVLVLEGEESENKQFIDLKKLVSLLPKGEYHMIEETGHLIPMEKPKAVLSIIKEFISEN